MAPDGSYGVLLPEADGRSSGSQPRVTVLMAAFNAEAFIGAAIDSLLGQTFTDFELIIVDDCSLDGTAGIVAAYDDPRIRLIRAPRNLGVVRARNLGFASARGTYLAIHDADDISHPTRLARQVAHFDSHPDDVLVTSDIRQLHPNGELVRTRHAGAVSPRLLDWMLHLGNPIAFSSVMMRTAALRRLPDFLREDRLYAEDYDLYVRLRAHGGIARLPEPLIIYRVHGDSTSSLNRVRMVDQVGRVLDDLWPQDLFAGADRLALAALVGRHIASGEAAANPEILERLRTALDALMEDFFARTPDCSLAERDAIALHASRAWEHLVRNSLRSGQMSWTSGPALRGGVSARICLRDLAESAARRMMPRRLHRALKEARGDETRDRPGFAGPMIQAPPVLNMTVVLEGSNGADAALAETGAGFALQAQEIFDQYGLRPVYLLDDEFVCQDEEARAIRTIWEAGRCAIGAWWRGSDSERCVVELSGTITSAIGTPPRFAAQDVLAIWPAGRRKGEIAANLIPLPVSAGIVVPIASLLDRMGGPGLGQADGPLGGLMHRADLTRQVRLVPNEVASEPQIVLIKSLLQKGERVFHMRLILQQGDAGTAQALDRLRRVCAYFFEDLGGLPGNATTLVPAVAAPIRVQGRELAFA